MEAALQDRLRQVMPGTRSPNRRASLRHHVLSIAVIAAVTAVAGLAYWDEVRDSKAALEDIAREQVSVATSVAAALATTWRSIDERAVLENFRGVERDGALRLFLARPGAEALVGTSDHSVSIDSVLAAISSGADSARVSRDDALRLGLPRRTALVGLADVPAGTLGGWKVVAAGSAWRERDRERWGYWRLILSVLTAGGLVLLFGGLALRTQRKELILERELVLSESRQEQDERLERANRLAALGTLAMGVAHEISTPLAVIAARAEQLLPRLDADERSGMAARAILDQTQRINEVIRGLLGLARGDWRSPERVSPAEVARTAAALVQHRFAKAAVELASDVNPDLPSIHGDPRLLENALVNLLLNACDACPKGGHVRLEVMATSSVVRFRIVDDGSGISANDVAKVLEPLFTTKASGSGTGLGLAIANEIVKSHLGTLTLQPVFPKGTRAEIEIPLADAKDSAA
ncbi:MAG TPA: HAMP domain-containing sensor histidine kinase [Polyangia bacterium]|nr:HAMP domain-containing sensor histidine kinase [Polyangia bacterium]